MSSPVSVTGSIYNMDLVDLDFSDTPSSALSLTFGSPTPDGTTQPLPLTPGSYDQWMPLVPDVTGKVTPKVAAAPLAVEEESTSAPQHEEDTVSEAETASPEKFQEEPEAPEPDEPSTSQAAASESGESTSSHLRAAAAPFQHKSPSPSQSKSLRVVSTTSPPSFFSDRADDGSQSALSIPTSPQYGIVYQPFFYGEAGYEAADVAQAAALSPSAAPFQLPPGSKPIRITSPSPAKSSPTKKVTPAQVPLPDSQPSSAPSRIVAPERAETPITHLARTMSGISITEGSIRVVGEDAPSDASDGPQTPALIKPQTADMPMSEEQAKVELEGLMDSFDEVAEMEQQLAKYVDAYSVFKGGIDEVVARLRYNLAG